MTSKAFAAAAAASAELPIHQKESDELSALFSTAFAGAIVSGYLFYVHRIRAEAERNKKLADFVKSDRTNPGVSAVGPGLNEPPKKKGPESVKSFSSLLTSLKHAGLADRKQFSTWRVLYGLLALCGFFGSWSTSIVVLDAFNIGYGLNQTPEWTGFLVSVESTGAIPGILMTYYFLQNVNPKVRIRGVFVYSTLLRVLSWALVTVGLACVSRRQILCGGADDPDDIPWYLQSGFLSGFLLFARALGGLSRGINTQISAPLVKYVCPPSQVSWYGPFLGLIAILGSMSATVFSSSQMELVAGIANSGFAHEGTGFMGVASWCGLLFLLSQFMTNSTFAEVMGTVKAQQAPPTAQPAARRGSRDKVATRNVPKASVPNPSLSPRGSLTTPLLASAESGRLADLRRESGKPLPPVDEAPSTLGGASRRDDASSTKAGEASSDEGATQRGPLAPIADEDGLEPSRINLIFVGALSISLLRCLMLSGVEDALSVTLQTKFLWPPDHIGFVCFAPIGGGIGAFLLTPYLKREYANDKRAPVIRGFMCTGCLGVALVWAFAGADKDSMPWAWFPILLGNSLLYLSVFGAERETLGILFQRMPNERANLMALLLSVCQLGGNSLGPPLSRTAIGDDFASAQGLHSYCLVQLTEVLAMGAIYEYCLGWIDRREEEEEEAEHD